MQTTTQIDKLASNVSQTITQLQSESPNDPQIKVYQTLLQFIHRIATVMPNIPGPDQVEKYQQELNNVKLLFDEYVKGDITEQRVLEILQIFTKALPTKKHLDGLNDMLQMRTVVEQDQYRGFMQQMSHLSQLLSFNHLDCLPVQVKHFTRKIHKVQGKIAQIKKLIHQFNDVKERFVVHEIMKCQAQGKVLGKDGACIALVRNKTVKPIPKTKLTPALRALETFETGENANSILDAVSERLNSLLFKAQGNVGSVGSAGST